MSAENRLIMVVGDKAPATVNGSEVARAMRDRLIVEAVKVTTVTDRIDADDATAVLRTLTTFLDEIETERERVKAPITKVGRDIDTLARELTVEVKQHQTRLSRLCGDFEAEERRRAYEAKIKAENEAARLAFEASKATAAAVQAAPTQEAANRAADKIAGEAQVKILEVRAVAHAVAPPKAADSTLRGTVVYEVDDIKKLHAAEPTLVTLEPNGAAIRAIIKANPNIILPGVRHWIENKFNAR